MKKLLPSLVLTLVCAVVCGLLAVVNAVTKDKIAQAETDKLQNSLTAVFGEGTYTTLEQSFEGVTAVYQSEDGIIIFDITVDGYSSGGIRALVGVASDGTVAGTGIVSCSETPGLGTQIQENGYAAGYTGASLSGTDVTGGPDLISGATKSSTGLKNAVVLALTTYSQMQEVQ